MCCRTISTVASISAREPLHDRFRHLRADPVVLGEANSARFIDSRRHRFGDIVKQNGKDKRHGNLFRRQTQHQPRVLKNVATSKFIPFSTTTTTQTLR